MTDADPTRRREYQGDFERDRAADTPLKVYGNILPPDAPPGLQRAVDTDSRSERQKLLGILTALVNGSPTPYSEDGPTVRLHVSVAERIIQALKP